METYGWDGDNNTFNSNASNNTKWSWNGDDCIKIETEADANISSFKFLFGSDLDNVSIKKHSTTYYEINNHKVAKDTTRAKFSGDVTRFNKIVGELMPAMKLDSNWKTMERNTYTYKKKINRPDKRDI